MATQHQISTNSRSVINSGITDDYKTALAEFIWNGFDAGASIVNISYETANELGALKSITISDNGKGIDRNTLELTFGPFLDSPKKQSYQRTSDVHGKRGKGRFSFCAFAPSAIWKTRYKDKDGIIKQYNITINKEDLSKFTESDEECVKSENSSIDMTGTDVSFYNIEGILEQDFKSNSFFDFIGQQFAWFLYLNEVNDFAIQINGIPIDYSDIIGINESNEKVIDDTIFNIVFIRWTRRIGEKYYYYLLDSSMHENCKVLTSFNNNNIDFYHSVYVASGYFDNFVFEKDPNPRLDGKKNQADGTYKKLMKYLKNYLASQEKYFVSEIAAAKLINDYEITGILPKFTQSTYDQIRKNDLTQTIKTIYSIQPKIFKGLQDVQKKTLVAFLNLLLDSEERDKILFILEGIVDLTPEEKSNMVEVLKSTTIRNMNAAVNMMHNRLEAVECLKTLVYDLNRFTTERSHIQKIMERCFWLFGEQFHIVSADKRFEEALGKYINILDGKETDTKKIDNEQRNRRPDIFMCRKHNVPDMNSSSVLEENVIVELKRPSVSIGTTQYRQIEDYMNLIINEPQFNSQIRLWKFFVVSTAIEKEVADKYKSFASYNKRFLVNAVNNFEIYAMTWDDLFKLFEINHSYILEKLDFSTESIANEIETVKKDVSGANSLTQRILQLEM